MCRYEKGRHRLIFVSRRSFLGLWFHKSRSQDIFLDCSHKRRKKCVVHFYQLFQIYDTLLNDSIPGCKYSLFIWCRYDHISICVCWCVVGDSIGIYHESLETSRNFVSQDPHFQITQFSSFIFGHWTNLHCLHFPNDFNWSVNELQVVQIKFGTKHTWANSARRFPIIWK